MMIVPSRIVCGVIEPCGSAVYSPTCTLAKPGKPSAGVAAPMRPLTVFCVMPGSSARYTAS